MSSIPRLSNAKVRKSLLQMLIGGIAGGTAMVTMLTALDRHEGLLEDGGRLAALATALVYALMAVFVGIGTMLPRFGAKALNVEDEDEIAEQKVALVVGFVTFALVAILLGSLALVSTADQPGLLPPPVAALISAGSALILIAIAIRYRNVGDEMMRLASKDASNTLVLLLLAVVGTKSAAAQLGYASPLAPLELLSAFFALYLLAVFISVGRRGLLTPR